MYIVMINEKNFQIIQDKTEAQRVTEELARSQKVYFFELKNVVETKLSWNKPSKSEKIKCSIQESIDNNFDAGGVFTGPSKEVPVFRLPAYIDPNSPFNPLLIQDKSFEVYPKIRVCEESKDPELFTKLTEIFDTSRSMLEESDNTQISITDYLDNLNNKDETIVIPAKSEIELFDSEFEKALETNEKNESEITQTFEVQEVSNYQVLEPVKESDITNGIVEQKVIKDVKAEVLEEKRFTLSIGKSTSSMSESNVKKQCEKLFQDALESEDPIEALKGAKANLESWYKNDNLASLDWFENLYTKYLPLASKKAVANLPAGENELKEDPLDLLLSEFENNLKEASKINEVRVLDILNDKKYSELKIKKKEKFLSLKNFHINEGMINDLVKSLDIYSGDPEELVKKYDSKTQKDQRVIDALKARKGHDESLFKSDAEIIKEIEVSNENNYSEVFLKYSKLALNNKDIQNALDEKQKQITSKELVGV